ncbi:MAG: IS66 family transposase [Kiritimatiellia bacterium]
MEPTREQHYRRRIAELERQVRERDERIAILEQQVRLRDERIAMLEQQVAQLAAQVAKLSKNSSNSSKPPSSDVVKPPKSPASKKGKKGRKKRKIGGQRGHERHDRKPFGSEELDNTWSYTCPCCPDCGGEVMSSRKPARVVQQVELVKPVEITEHQSRACWCPRCRKTYYAPLPEEVTWGGLVGPKLTALVAYLKGVCHTSFTTIRKFFRDVLHMKISRGQLAKLINKATASLDGMYAELLARLPAEARLNVDETGHQENGQALWTWCFRAELYTLFKIDPSRGSEVLIATLGEEFDGVLGCDYFSAYQKYMKDFSVTVQFCLAHLIRDVKFLTTLPDKVTQNYGRRLLEALRKLFRVIHRREQMTPEQFQRALEKARKAVLDVGRRAPPRKEARNLANRFRKHGKAYFQFITTPGIEPTNNLAEQAIRFVVIDRKVTQGTRSEKGRRWCERIWTLVATCAQQGRSVFDYLEESITAYLCGQPAPSLIPVKP